MSLPDENTSMVDRLGQSKLEHLEDQIDKNLMDNNKESVLHWSIIADIKDHQ